MQHPLDLEKLENSGFDPKKRTIVIIAGFLSQELEPWMHRMKDTWLELEDLNVILVSWHNNNRMIYDRAVANTPLVARQISIFLYYLAEISESSVKDIEFTKHIHLVGHSLGAHIAGFVGKDLGGNLGRITGLDPAGPSFDKFEPEWRLHWTDALLVEAYHTNMGRIHYFNAVASSILSGLDIMLRSSSESTRKMAESIAEGYSGEGNSAWFGIEAQSGHIDYLVNNGKTQPGCQGLMHICDHLRSHEIYQNILDYEVQLMKDASSKGKSRSKEDRLLAFKSGQANQFIAGSSFVGNCSSLLNTRDKQFAKAIQSCSVPIDPIGDIDQLRQELKQDYGIDFSNGTNPRFYFKTREDEPYVGNHYLLRLSLIEPKIWSNSCALQATIGISNNNKTSVIKLNQQFQTIDMSSEFQGVAIPFINPNGFEADLATKEVIGLAEDKLNQNSPEYIDAIRRFVPERIDLQVMPADATRIKEKVKNMIWTNKDAECNLTISQIEVQSIKGDMMTIMQYRDFEMVTKNADTPKESLQLPITITKNSTKILRAYNPSLYLNHESRSVLIDQKPSLVTNLVVDSSKL